MARGIGEKRIRYGGFRSERERMEEEMEKLCGNEEWEIGASRERGC